MASVDPIQLAGHQRAPVLVIGAHRSGTTATARALELLGLQIGQRLDSHRESKAMQRLHEDYLKQCGASWFRPEPFLEQMRTAAGVERCTQYLRENFERRFAELFAYGNNPAGFWLRFRLRRGVAWGWKEPRTTLFAPAWLKLFPDASLVHVVRDSNLVAASIRRRELDFREAGDAAQPGLDDLGYCARLAETYVGCGEAAGGLTKWYRQVQFEELQANPAAKLRELAAFCGLEINDSRLVRSAATIKPPRVV